MADDILTNFLVKISYQQDEKSKKDFDNSLRQTQSSAEAFGAKIGELPTIVNEATKRISSSLSELYYSAQKNGATARELDALRFAAEQSGEGADRAQASFDAFSQQIRDFATGAGAQYKRLFGVDVDPNHTFEAFLRVREKIEELRNKGGTANLSLANMYARTFRIDEEALIKGRLPIFRKALEEQFKRNSDIEAEKAAALTRAYNALAAALETVARKADAALFDKFGSVLDRLTKWLDEDSERIVRFFTELATQIGLVFTDLSKLKPAFVFLWEALKEVGGWLQKIIGQPDSGLAGVRHLLELISGAVMARFVLSMVAGFAAAFAPLTALLAILAALGIISYGAYAAGGAVSGLFGIGSAKAAEGPVPVGPGPIEGPAVGGHEAVEGSAYGRHGATEEPTVRGFSAYEAPSYGGHGATRRQKFGHGGAPVAAGAVMGGATFEEKAPDIMNRLMSQFGLTKEQAAGILGNLGHESAGFTAHHEAGQPANRGGVGWAQWTGPRRRQFEAWAADHNLDPRSDEASYRYLTEGDPQFAGAIAAIKKEKTVAGSVRSFESSFEGAASYAKAYGSRNRYAARALKATQAAAVPASRRPLANLNLNKPIPDFHKALETIRAAKPVTPWQQSTNEVHDHRAVTNDVNIHVAGGFPVEKTERPLSRPRNADLIRNTASYAA